eukprot:CAMPEP_0182433932 /NCGR_PEP_ID=MMETSP1167-20130531/66506_1 /TAXON_ID=2988 /ORGANISM="Mallomonas Sp, Strain CCMP3275" /LENGTH=215 /DNA_ID=CAMNT_0024623207 /DNA_START=308 /DNA_END=955 /DNA_ORIENTATION=+
MNDAGEKIHDQEKVKTLFSLSHDRSVRLKHYGSWIAYEDQINGTTFYYNHRTYAGQWEVPDRVKKIERQEQTNSSMESVDVAAKRSNAKKSMRIKKVGDWIEYRTEMEGVFYYNDNNGDFQFVDPSDNTSNEEEEGKTQRSSEPETAGDLSDWKPYKDPNSGEIFWHNQKTNVSQWECPSVELSRQRKQRMYDAGDYDEEQDVVNVYNDADLGIG